MIYQIAIFLLLLTSTAFAGEYNRADWGPWTKGTREAVISKNTVEWAQCAYTLAVVPRDALQIDHVVPVAFAAKHGGESWTREQRRKFFNDRDNLLLVLSGVNAQKGDRTPGEWMPEVRRCEYLKTWATICNRYAIDCPNETIAEMKKAERCGE